MSQQQQHYEMLTNIMKRCNDTQQSIVKNLKA
jgi:hypothetical protein